MIERRKVDRMSVDMSVKKHTKEGSIVCRACEISPSGIKLKRVLGMDSRSNLVDIEVPLVEGSLTTAIKSRKVWQKSGFEAFEFVGRSFAQQAMLERLFGNY